MGEIHFQPAVRRNSVRLGTGSPKEGDMWKLLQLLDAPVLTTLPQKYEW